MESQSLWQHLKGFEKKKRKELAQVERVAIQGGDLGKLWQIQKEVNALMDKEERL